MDRVLDRLYIGDLRDLEGPVPFKSLGFTALVDLRDGQHPARTDSVEVYNVRNRDGDAWSRSQVESTLDFITDRIRHGRVLVACAAGMSRSACVVIGYLTRCGYDVASAYSLLRTARPQIAPVTAMLNSVLEALGPEKPIAQGSSR